MYAGRLLPPTATIGVLGLDVESCIHIVHKTTSRGVDHSPMSPALSVAAAYDSVSASHSAGWRLERPEEASVPLPLSLSLDASPSGGAGSGPSHPTPVPVTPSLTATAVGSTSSGPATRDWGGSSGGGGSAVGGGGGLGNPDTTLIPFKPLGVPADVLFENDNATAETSGKWVTVMADCPGVSSGRLEWELKVGVFNGEALWLWL